MFFHLSLANRSGSYNLFYETPAFRSIQGMDGTVPIAEDAGGDIFYIDFKADGTIGYFIHESRETLFLCSSFEALVDGLVYRD